MGLGTLTECCALGLDESRYSKVRPRHHDGLAIASVLALRDQRVEDLPDVVQDPQVPGARNEGRFAVGNGLGEISAHGGRNTWVIFALPEVHPDFDMLQRKAPWSPVVDHELVRRAGSSLPQGFGQAYRQVLPYLSPFDHGLVNIRHLVDQPFDETVPSSKVGKKGHVEPNQGWRMLGEEEKRPVGAAHPLGDSGHVRGTRATDHTNRGQPLRNLRGASKGSGASPRHAQNSKAIQSKRVRQLAHIVRPVEQLAARVEVRATKARPIGRDEP